MKKIFFSLALLCALQGTVYAQAFPSGIPNLGFRVELVDNPGSFSYNKWSDVSGNGITLSAPGAASTPVFVSNSYGTGFSAVRFDGVDDILNEAVIAPANMFTNNEATIFVVRIQPVNGVCNNLPNWGPGYQALASISSSETGAYGYFNEFAMVGDVSLHHYRSGNYSFRKYSCYPSLPVAKPVVLSASFGSSAADMNCYVNNNISGVPIGTPTGSLALVNPYSSFAVARKIHLGGRYDEATGMPADFFNGDLLEVIAYNRKLTPAEMSQVNQYLRCKYNVNYTGCNPALSCTDDHQCQFNDPAGNPYYPVTGKLKVSFTGTAPNGDCNFSATVTVAVSSGFTVHSYEWIFPDGTSVFTTTPSLTDTKGFSWPSGSTPTKVKVVVHTVNSSMISGSNAWCCDHHLEATAWCNMP